MLGKQLKQLREAKQKNQKEVCSELNIEQSTLANYENDKRVPKLDILIKLAEYYQCSVDYLLGIEKTNESSAPLPSFVQGFRTRLSSLIADANISTDQFQKMTGIKNMEDLLSGRKAPAAEEIIKISSTLDVSSDYLLCITDSLKNSDTLQLSKDESYILKTFRSCEDIEYTKGKFNIIHTCVETQKEMEMMQSSKKNSSKAI